jgi:hypothetical protein
LGPARRERRRDPREGGRERKKEKEEEQEQEEQEQEEQEQEKQVEQEEVRKKKSGADKSLQSRIYYIEQPARPIRFNPAFLYQSRPAPFSLHKPCDALRDPAGRVTYVLNLHYVIACNPAPPIHKHVPSSNYTLFNAIRSD